jgi:hypothetical protein
MAGWYDRGASHGNWGVVVEQTKDMEKACTKLCSKDLSFRTFLPILGVWQYISFKDCETFFG